MCDSLAEGGRRCPCNAPEARAAQRQAKKAAGEAPVGGVGAGGTSNPAVASPVEGWDRDAVTAVAADVSLVAGKSLDDMAKEPEHVRAAAERIREQYGTTEAAVRAVGAQIAQEAERRAGVNAQTVAEASRAVQEAARDHLDQLKRRRTELQEFIAEHPAQERAAEARGRQQYEALTDEEYDRMDQIVAEANAEMAATPEGQELLAVREELAEASGVVNSGHADAQTRAQMTALSRAYVEVLAETRQMGGRLDLVGTEDRAASTMDEVAQVYPADWVEASNASSRPLQVIADSGWGQGGSYRDHMVVEQVREVDAYEPYQGPQVEAPEYSYGTITDPDDPDEQMSVRFKYDVEIKGAGADAPGPGWTLYEGPGAVTGASTWRRPERMEEDRMFAAAGGVISISAEPRGGAVTEAAKDPLFSVGVHEVGHHFEARVPGIVALEREFLLRRTTDENGNRLPQAPLWGGSGMEGDDVMVRADSFADAYMSREYPRGDGYEVMTTGAEALFGGQYGGLVGQGRYQGDPDMRAFVLGVMAGVGRKEGQG